MGSEHLLFTGQSEHTIDSKQRLAIPAKYRNQWDTALDGAAWYSAPWSTGCLCLYTEAMFNRLSQERPSTLMPDEGEADLERIYFSNAERLEMDSAGRIAIPRYQLERTSLRVDAPVVVLGVRDHLEVHDKSAWAARAARLFPEMPALIKQKAAAARGEPIPPPAPRAKR